jgi:hypothetical protein
LEYFMGATLTGEKGGGFVVASDEYGVFRVPGWFLDALERWAKSKDFPKKVPMQIKDGELVIDIRPKGRKDRKTERGPNRC